MTTVRKFRPPNRLARMIKESGGLMAKDAIAAAELGVEGLREVSLAGLDAALSEIERRFGPGSNRESESFDVLYDLTMKIIDVGIFVADSGVDQAAISLAATVDSCAETGAWRWDAIDVHLNALRLLRTAGASLPEADRQAMLEGLYKVSHRKVGEA
jgi:hypothetical protein